VARTQEALYSEIDLELSWSERELPERERTKHVHRLHPYLGKFVPQLVETLIQRHLVPGQRVLDPFAGSGTTLVQSLESGLGATGCDVAAFNCLLMRVKTRRYNLFVLERELRDACARLARADPEPVETSDYVRAWYAPQAAAELLFFRSLIDDYESADVLRIVLARAARSARKTTHFDLDFPRVPQEGEYWCHKHKRTCRPVETSAKFLTRYTLDTLTRLKEFARLRARGREAEVMHGDARELDLRGPSDCDRHLAAVSGPDRLPRAASVRRTSCSASRTGARSSSAGPSAGRAAPRSPSTPTESRRCCCGRAPHSVPALRF